MTTKICRLLVVMLPLILASCATPNMTDSPYVPVTMDAIHQFYAMKEAGKLPGIPKDVHGDLQTEAIPQSVPVVYPVSVTLHVTTALDHSVYCYLFTKHSKLSEWRLVRASQMLTDGKFVDLKIQQYDP